MSERPRKEEDEAILELAAMDALQGSPPIAPEDELRYDPCYLAARRAFEEAAALLAFAVPPATPPPGLKERLLARIASDADSTPKEPFPEGSFRVFEGVDGVRTREARWVPHSVPGVEFKVIRHDSERRCTTRLVRFSAGMSIPDHRHVGAEEIFVVEGSLSVNGIVLNAGDYCRSDAATEEHGTHTSDGALAIVVSSDDADVVLASDVEN